MTEKVKKPTIKKAAIKEVATTKKAVKTASKTEEKEVKTTVKTATKSRIIPLSKDNAKLIKPKTTKKEDNFEVKEISEKKVKIVKTKNDKKTDSLDRVYATGKRKSAIAKVWLKKGSGKITINNKEAKEYLKRDILEVIVNEALKITDTQDKYDVACVVLSGGLSGQAEAIRLGIAKALNILNPEAYRKDLKVAGLLTRDSRVVERKKPGLKKARKGQVFSKR